MSSNQKIGRLDFQKIVEASEQQTGLSEIGEPAIDEGLKVLIDSLNNEANLHPAGIASQHSSLKELLVNRLRLNQEFEQHPEIFAEKIDGPVIIVGLPRSGTTKTQRILAATGTFQYLPLWKIMHPAPVADVPAGEPDPRIGMTEQLSRMMQEHYPDFYAGHPMNALDADEEVFMADLVLRGWNACYSFNAPSFESWLLKQDFTSWYQYLYKLLQMFQWQDGGSDKSWLLKTCEHIAYLPELFKMFPKATIVHCHRDPVTTVTSISALAAASRRMHSDSVDAKQAGAFLLRHLSREMGDYLEQRALLESNYRFVDIAYADLVGDVIPVMERIYGSADIPFTDKVRESIVAWENQNPIAKHGKHKYSLEEVGLREADIHTAFAGYLKQFGHLL